MAYVSPQALADTRRISSIERAEKAVRLRRAGMSYARIADTLEYADRSSAYRAIQKALSRMIETEDARELRELESQRLDELQTAHWPRAMRGDIPAGRMVLRIIDRRARLLGLDLNEARMAGAMEASAIAEIAQVSMLQAHLIGALNDAGVPLELQDLVIGALNLRLQAAHQKPSEDEFERREDDIEIDPDCPPEDFADLT